jgi:hypothetical protein
MKDAITTPQQFFDRVVVPDVEAFKANPEDVRLAFHAAISLHHLREWVFKSQPDPKPDFAGQWCPDLYKRCEALKFIRDLASNAKHFPPTQANVLEVGVSANPQGWDKSIWGVAKWDEVTQDQVIAKDEGGRSAWVVPVILDAFLFWSKEPK